MQTAEPEESHEGAGGPLFAWEEFMDVKTGERTGLTRRGALKLGLGSVVAAAAFGPGARIVMAQEGQVLKAINPAFSQDWSPLRGGGVPFRWNSVWNASAMYFNEKGEIQPYVLTEWTPSADYLTWTLKVNPDAKFADGSAITAAISGATVPGPA